MNLTHLLKMHYRVVQRLLFSVEPLSYRFIHSIKEILL